MDKIFFLALVCCKQTVEGFTLFVKESQLENITLKCKLHDDTKNITWCFVRDHVHLSCTKPDIINVAEMGHTNTEQKLEANKIIIRNLRNNSGMYFCAKGNVEASVFKTMLGSLKNRTTCLQLDQFLVLSRDTQNEGFLDTAPEERYQGQTVTLQCTFPEVTQPHKVFWIKYGVTSQCLYSFSYETLFQHPDSNSDCCIEKETYIVQNQTQDKKQSHNITLSNLTDSDAGMYTCVIYLLNNNHWAAASNITLKVNKCKSMTSDCLPPTTDIIGHGHQYNKQTSEVIIFPMLGMAVAAGLLGGLLCFIKRKKRQLSSNLGLKRNEDLTLQNDTVTPYAVFNRTEDMPEDVMKAAMNHKMKKDEEDNTEFPLYSLLGSKSTASSVYYLVEHDPRVITNEEMSWPEENKNEGFVDNILYDSAK